MGEALGAEDSTFLVVVHGESSTGHLDHSVVDGLIGNENSLVVGVFDRKKGSGGLMVLVGGSDIQKDLEMDVATVLWALAYYSYSVAELGY